MKLVTAKVSGDVKLVLISEVSKDVDAVSVEQISSYLEAGGNLKADRNLSRKLERLSVRPHRSKGHYEFSLVAEAQKPVVVDEDAPQDL